MKYFVCALLFYASTASAMMANLVSQRFSTSVGGMAVVVCTYNAGGTMFQIVLPMGNQCQPVINVN